ncbi:hypothetical protein ON010_g11503 [Phytophthora cinnamomi]|nr:hypothetical protein ON010_g11503 [Phytophthora cinnamomi]
MAPPKTPKIQAHAQQCIATWTPDHDEAMNNLWRIWATVTPVKLWRLRNAAVFKQELTPPMETAAAVWSAGIYQVKTISEAWKTNPATRTKAWCLGHCLSILTSIDPKTPSHRLDAWLLRIAVSAPTQQLEGGGWIMYHQHNGLWRAIKAGSLDTTAANTSRERARGILTHGMRELIRIAQPETLTSALKGA